mgnify:CR=1 FL=1
MPAEKARAIVLRVVEWSETSSIVTLFTEDFGKVGAAVERIKRHTALPVVVGFDARPESRRFALDVVGVLAAVFPARRAARLDVLRAIAPQAPLRTYVPLQRGKPETSTESLTGGQE